MSKKPVTQAVEKEQETEFDPILRKAASKEEAARRLGDAGAGLRGLAAVAQELDEMLPGMAAFTDLRVKIGEYDASAAAIIEMAKTQLRLAEFMRACLKAHMDLELDR